MSDGKVVIEIELDDGSVVKGVSNIDKQMNSLNPSAQKATRGIKDMVTALGLVKLASAGFDVLKQSLDAAISRFDTMERYPKVMKSLGFSSEESSTSVKKLADGIDGLPTSLDEVVSTSQRMTAITGNMNKSTDATIALNNAMLASGASTADASRGMDQYIQMLSTGEVDLQSWKTLQETMPIGLQKTAEAMGYVGETAQRELYAALKEGDITFKDFQNQLIELGTGTGELAELAKVNSEGIATSFGNLRNAAAKGIANIMKDLDNLSKAVTGKNIAKNIDSMKVLVNKSFEMIGKTIQATTPIVILFAKALDVVYTSGKALSPVLIGLAAGYAALKVIEGVNSLIIGSHAALQMAALSGKALTIVTKAKMTAQIADTSATKADIIAKSAQNGVISISTALIGVLTGGISAHTVATTIATAATTVFSTALKVLSGPVGWVVGGITLLVGGAAALWKWFNKDTEATAKLKKEQEKLNESTKALNESTKQNNLNREEELSSIESSSEAYKDLVSNITALAGQEKLSRGSKKELSDQIEQLNKQYADLNLKYDEETGKLSMSTEQLNKKIEAHKEQEKLAAGQEQLLAISKEQAEVDAKLAEAAELRKQYNEQLKGSYKEGNQARKGLNELDTTEKELKESAKVLGEEHQRVSEVVKQSSESVAKSIQENAEKQIITYESLSERQQESVKKMQETFNSLHQSATNAFSKIETQSEISLGQMLENMNHNQEAVRVWGENQAALLEWAGKTGHDSFIPFIESIGVDQAGVLAEMAAGLNGNNVEQAALLEQLANTYDAGFGKAADAGKNSMKVGLEGLPKEISDMIITPTYSMNDEVKMAFEGMGKNVGQGAKQGVDGSKKEFKDSTKDLAKEGKDGFKQEMDINSPSRVFKGYGDNIVQGLANGVSQSLNLINTSMNELVTGVKKPFDNLQSEMEQIGNYAIQGLNNGLANNANSVYSTAQNIADNVKNTIQSALDVHSPSRWMENFIGKNMMVGWERGLEKYANLPVNAIKKATDMVKMPVLRAETIVGGIPSAGLVGGSNTTNSTTNQYQSNFDGFMRGAVFNVREEADIDKISDALLKKQQQAEGQMGVRRIR